MSNDPWDGILDEGEKILWQGRPDPRVRLGLANWAGFGFGLLFAGFAAVWMGLASMAGGGFWMFGLLHFAVGLGVAASSLFWPAWRRRHTWYTLTDRRAFIATDIPLRGRTLRSYPIDAHTRVQLTGDDPATIHFAKDLRQTKNGTRTVPIGFERIHDAQEVYRMMRDVRMSARVRSEPNTSDTLPMA